MEQNAKNLTILFILIQVLLYASFLAVDLAGGSVRLSSYIKFTIIILCFCYALFLGKSADKSILLSMRMALFFTLVSDLFILLLDQYYNGVLTFIFAQQLYGIRLSMVKYNSNDEKEASLMRRDFLIRLAFQAVVLVVICLLLVRTGTKLDELLIASILYFLSILTNFARGIRIAASHKKKRELVLFAVGITLFLLCDINVGIFNLSGYVQLPETTYHVLYNIASILMWAFYAPSQVVLALSTRERSART